jgi:hypothetical protein
VAEGEISRRWIGRGGTEVWPPRSPDLTPEAVHASRLRRALENAVRRTTRGPWFYHSTACAI